MRYVRSQSYRFIMGCDIHVFLEKFEDGEWKSLDVWEEDEYEEDEKYLFASYEHRIYKGRNYALFGVLAGVRYTQVPMLCEPKGFPDDASDLVTKDFERWGCDAHTPSYLNLNELLDFDWDKKQFKENFTVPLEDYIGWHVFEKDRGISLLTRQSWGLLTVTYSEGQVFPYADSVKRGDMAMEDAVSSIIKNETGNIERFAKSPKERAPHVNVEYMMSCGELSREFMDSIEEMKKIARSPEKYDDVRIVFWFDN